MNVYGISGNSQWEGGKKALRCQTTQDNITPQESGEEQGEKITKAK